MDDRRNTGRPCTNNDNLIENAKYATLPVY